MWLPTSSTPMVVWRWSLKARSESTSAPMPPKRLGRVSDAGE